MQHSPAHRSLRRLTLLFAAVAVFSLALGMSAPPLTMAGQGQTSMLTVHLLMELFAIIIAVLVVVVSLHAFDPRNSRAGNVMICGFVIVAVCDVVHALTYEGMPALLAPSSTSRAIFFWLMGRTFEVSTMALIALHWMPPLSRKFWLGLGLAVSALLVWVGSFGLDLFPTTFIKGQGVTAFKARYEYALLLGYLLVAHVFWRNAERGGDSRNYILALSSFVMGIGEVMFTAYVAPSDFQNIFGHSYKIASYSLLYWATFVASIRAPFEAVMRSELRLRESEERIRVLSSNLPHSVVCQFSLDAGASIHYAYVSESARRIYGLGAEEILQDAASLHRLMPRDDLRRLVEATLRSANNLGTVDETVQLKLDGGGHRWIQITAAPRRLTDGSILWDGVHTDITEKKAADDQIARLGFYDSLTGLPNRRLLMDRLGQAITASARSGKTGALFFLDLDNFKNFNDTLGHDMGDELLKQVALRLAGSVRGRDTVSRFGGDEFVVILDGLSGNRHEAAVEAQQVAEKLLSNLRVPFVLGSDQRFITLSIGINLFGDQPTTIEELMKGADLAMYRAKSAGRNALRFFDPQMQVAASDRAALEADMRLALQNQQFVLHYQPLMEAGRAVGVEALVRWQDPQRGLISPARFIPVAEESGLIVPLGLWILDAACNQLAQWAWNPATSALTISVNVSARQFNQSDFVDQVFDTLERTRANPRLLKLELTESMLVDDVEAIIGKMTALQVRGVSFSLDDFGTGYSSLSYLKLLPISVLKIDQSFVRDVLIDPNDAAIARTIITLGQSLGLTVVAEGVETQGQLDFLQNHNCRTFQGYLFCKPLPIDAFEAWFQAWAPKAA